MVSAIIELSLRLRTKIDLIPRYRVKGALLPEAPRSPAELNPEVPPALAALVLCLQAKVPEERVQTARELERRLQSLG